MKEEKVLKYIKEKLNTDTFDIVKNELETFKKKIKDSSSISVKNIKIGEVYKITETGYFTVIAECIDKNERIINFKDVIILEDRFLSNTLKIWTLNLPVPKTVKIENV